MDINVFHFAPQNNNALINAAHLRDANACNETKIKIHKSQCSKANSTIERIGRVDDIKDVVKVCANSCAIQHSIIDVEGGGVSFPPRVLCESYSVHPQHGLPAWYAKNASKLLHLHFIFMQKLNHVFTQLAKFSSKSKNNNLVKHGKSTFDIKILSSAIEYASLFLLKMEEYGVEDSVPTNVPSFAQGIIVSMKLAGTASAKPVAPKTGTGTKPAKDKPDEKRQKKNPKKNTDFTNLGLFHAKEGVKDGSVFPSTLKQPLCSKFCLQGKACDKPKQACKFSHAVTWKSIKEEDQKEILKYCNATNNIWFDKEMMKKHKSDLPRNMHISSAMHRAPSPRVRNFKKTFPI
jgi:hypothetical protein